MAIPQYKSERWFVLHMLTQTTHDDVLIPYHWYLYNDTESYEYTTMEQLVNGLTENIHDGKLVVFVEDIRLFFEYVKYYFSWNVEDMFFIGKTSPRPLIIRTLSGLEFRCAKSLLNADIEKLKHANNIDTVNDDSERLKVESKLLYDTINELKLRYKDRLYSKNARMPLTHTGYPRRNIKRLIKNNEKNKNILYTIQKKLTLQVDEYLLLHDAYRGGEVGTDPEHTGEVINNVLGIDIRSSYPSAMLQFRFPVSKGISLINDLDGHMSIEEFESYREDKATMLVAHFEFKGVKLKRRSGISIKALPVKYQKVVEQYNGKIYAGDMSISFTDVDYYIFKDLYDFDDAKVIECYAYIAGPLPPPITDYVLKLYEQKTLLKGGNQEDDYEHIKQLLNSIYGCMATDPINTEYTFDDNTKEARELIRNDIWGKQLTTEEILSAKLNEHNTNNNRVLFYPWGVWISSYGRLLLHEMTIALEDAGLPDYYYDTDSHYTADTYKAIEIINTINDTITERFIKMKHDIEKISPKNIHGDKQTLGHWDIDGHYQSFKTLGKKRYMTIDTDGRISTTISGLSKRVGLEYIIANGGLDAFDTQTVIPPEHTNKIQYEVYNETISVEVQKQTLQFKSYVVAKREGYSLDGDDISSMFTESYQKLFKLLDM